MESVKVIIEVRAGLIPGQPIGEYTKRWALTTDQWQDQDYVMQAYGHAQEYARNLWNPASLNWVVCEWVWI